MNVNSEDIEAGSIAIVGLAGRFPASRTASELWSLLVAGKEAAQWMSDDELRTSGVSDEQLQDPDYVRASLVLPDMEMFDADFFGFSKRDASVLDPQHRHFLECAWEALEDAGHMPESFGGAIGVFGGCGMQAYLPYNLLTNPALVKSMGLFLLRHTGNDKDFLTTRLSYLLDLKGPSMSIQTACSTSLVAVHVASQSLLSGECDMALAGGVSIELPHRQGYQYADGEIMSPDGHCRAFDENANGTVFGSGAGVVVLRRLADAIRDRDNIYAVIRGSAVNNDGYQKAGYLAPSVDGQASAAVEALAVAGVEPATVSYIEAHGTGTPVGDPIEIAALTQAYGTAAAASLGIGSLKTNIGHLDTAAGVASLIKVSLALRHGLIPPSLNFSQPNSRFDIAKTPFYIVDSAKPWPKGSQPRRAAVNSLGVGGTNAHVIVEEAPAAGDSGAGGGDGWQVLTLSARTPASLQNLKNKWLDFLTQAPASLRLADAAFTTQAGRKAFEHRCALVARDIPGLQVALVGKGNVRVASGQTAAGQPAVVMMFAGGGAQYPGAGRELLAQPAFRKAVDACFKVMPSGVPADLRAVMFDADVQDAAAARKLERPGYALPALFTLEYALAKLWESWGVKPAAVMGHSAGEYTAACLAGVMSLEDALSVVCLRGELFETVPAGAMLSVDLPEADLRSAIDGLPLDIAAINGPDLCIASGSLEAIAQLEQRLARQSVECRRLRIDVAAHSRLLDGVLDRFRARVSAIALQPPTIAFVSNLTGTWVEPQTLTDPEYWVRHLRNPVRFADGLNRVFAMPDSVLLEVGPGQGLSALARQNSSGQARTIVPSTGKAQGDQGDLAVMLLSAGALWTRGALPDWNAMRGALLPRRISLPTYAFDHQRHWVEPGRVLHGAQPATQPIELAVAAGPMLKRLSGYDEWFSVPQWQAQTLPPANGGGMQGGQTWLLFGNRSQLTSGIIDRIGDVGASVVVVRRGEAFAKLTDGSFTVTPDDPQHYASLFDSLAQSELLPDRILHLWSLDTHQGLPGSEISGQALAFDSLVQTARAIQLLDYAQPISLTVVTAGSQSVAGEAIPHPERALALGPCRVIPREMPALRTRLIDFSSVDVSSDFVLQSILDECDAAPDTDLVAYRDRQRWASHLVAASSVPGAALPSRIRQGGVYLISGGLGDIAIELAGFLASSKQARLALVSRRTLPPKSTWRQLAASGEGSAEARVIRRLLACEDSGGEVLALTADVSDPAAMARVVADCRAHFGVINGVFHAAGTLDDGPIATKTLESVRRVLGPKAVGAQVLHGLLPPGDLDFFAVFSSTSVYLGAAGQVDYVAANAFIDALAASRSDGLSIHWGIWGDSGMAARAYGSHALGHDGLSAVHPLLGVQVADEDGAVFEANYSAAHLWVLREHGVAGRPVLPGTAYVEIARAAMAVLHPGSAIEVRALSFEEAMVFDGNAARQVRVELRRTGEGYDLLVRSRSDAAGAWLDHARAGVGLFSGSIEPAPTRRSDWIAGKIPQAHAVAFGPRWSNIARMQIGTHEAVADMQLPPKFTGDLAEYGAHPALTDMAATFGLHLIDAGEREGKLYVPLSIERIRLVAAVPGAFFSHVERNEVPGNRLVSFDASLYAPDGSPIATFEGFSLRGVMAGAVTQQAQVGLVKEPSLIEAMLACGIKAEDSHEVFTRVLSSAKRDLTVSSIALDDLGRVMAQSSSRLTSASAPGSAKAKGDNAGDAALNPVERAIAEVWRDLLGVQEVALDDDFFALGGHSLAAVRLFAKIRKQFGVDLPLATLFQAPTLAELAAMVSRSGGLDTTQAVAVLKKISSTMVQLPQQAWSPLVTICKGDSALTPIFCVHGAGGNVLNFKVISDRLGRDQPFYGLQAQGVDGLLKPLSSVEAMASQYVQAIRMVGKTGPYRLAGYSGGGVIAYEMAQQLIASGSQVEFLGMIDTLAPDAARKKVSLLTKLALARRWTLKFALKWPERRRIARKMRQSDAVLFAQLARGDALTEQLIGFNLYHSFVAAQAQYVPKPYPGSPILIFRADQAKTSFPDPAYLAAGKSLGWSAHVAGGVRVVDVPGSHITMLAEPGLSVLIAGWKQALVQLDHSRLPSAIKVSAVDGKP